MRTIAAAKVTALVQWRIQGIPVRHGISPFESQKITIISEFMHVVSLFYYENQQKML